MWSYVFPLFKWFLYYVIFIDDLSRKCWIYFIKAKSETFEKLKKFKSFIENQSSKQIKILRTDNRGEYESHSFENFYKESRIKRQLFVPYILSKMVLLKGKIRLSMRLQKP